MGYTFCILSRVLLSFFIISHLSIILQLFIVLFYILFEGQNSCGQEVISLDTILRLRELMNSRGWSEYRLAKESKLSMSTISNIFHRGSIPSIPTLETLCNTFGISLGQFFSKGVSFKWSKQKFVCGKIMVKRKITAKLAVIFLKNGGPNRDRTDDLTDANRTLSQTVHLYAPQTTRKSTLIHRILSQKIRKCIWPRFILRLKMSTNRSKKLSCIITRILLGCQHNGNNTVRIPLGEC